MQVFRPDEITQCVRDRYAAFVHSMHAHWKAAAHPDTTGTGAPSGRVPQPTPEELALLMRERIGAAADRVAPSYWHKKCYSPKSSQALVVEVLALLEGADALHLLCDRLAGPGYTVAFEGKQGRTQFDAIICRPSGRIAMTVEAKFMENGPNKCPYPSDHRCDGTWWDRPGQHRGCPMATARGNRATADRYWATAGRLFGCASAPQAPETCPLWAGYQVVHNLAETEALDPDAVWMLICDGRNPYFSDAGVGWANTLAGLDSRITVITWQHLMTTALEKLPGEAAAARERIRHLMQVHGW